MNWNKRKFLSALAALPLTLPAYSSLSQETRNKSKILLLYYSRTENTARLAGLIQKSLALNAIRLEAIPNYPTNYDETVAQVRAENASGYSPPIKDNIPDLRAYDVIILGSPIWADQLSLPVKSFLQSYNLAGKKIVPFLTYIVSSQGGRSMSQIMQLQPKARLAPLLSVLGEEAGNAEPQVKNWLKEVAI